MKTHAVLVVVPARMASTRFPGKPLAVIADLPMVEHVRRRAQLCRLVDEAQWDHDETPANTMRGPR